MIRGIHLDLKGLPPTPERLLSLLELLAAVKINAVLVEWEDSFPWEVDPRFRSETAYTAAQVERFHRRAAELGIEMIPLVQSLGHMETPLRLDQYAPLREIPDRCDVLNPLADGARALVERMIDDVLGMSPGVRHFHLGGDEAWTFGSHPDTRAYIERYGKAALYLRHIEPLLDKLGRRGIRPILWHDMMADWDATALARVAQKADLMVWSYRGHPRDARKGFDIETIERFAAAGAPMWGACAYKGADGADADLPDIPARVANAEAWAEVAARFNMRGVVATAWSRYATHRVQCEPIDGALDALVKVATALLNGNAADDTTTQKILENAGEFERFRSCRHALAKLAEARGQAWQYELMCRQQFAVEYMDERRRGSGILQQLEKLKQDHVEAARVAADDVRKALAGLIEPRWIEEYLTERLEPLAFVPTR